MATRGLETPQGHVPTRGTRLNGVLAVTSLAALQERDRTLEAIRAAQEAQDEPVVTALADHIRGHWSIARRAKQKVEQEMLSAVRSRRGEYDPETLSQIKAQGGSEIYMMLFATKARQLKALLTDTIIGTGTEKPWTLNPTPVPTLPPEDQQAIMQQVYVQTLQAEQVGAPMEVDDVRARLVEMRADAERLIMERARLEAERAEDEVEEVMVEGGFLEALDEFIDDLCTFKTAFMKGPVVRMATDLEWTQGADGNAVPQVAKKPKRVFERVDPFMIYPMPWARTPHDAPLFERHKLSRGDLSALLGVEGYNDDAIRAALDEHGVGGLHQWLDVDAQRADAEGRDVGATAPRHDETIDALQYWGSVSGRMLREWGMGADEVPDEAQEYEVECWLVGNWVLKAALNPDPLGRRPYFSDGFSRVPGAFWHNSLFDVVRDCQDMCNAAARALANNMGIASGPQVVTNVDRLPQGEDITQMYPWKIWQVTNDPTGSSARPIDFFQPGSNVHELMGVFERFSDLADEYSGVPKYMTGLAGGEGGAGRTASGLSMMIGNASKQVKNTIASIDLHVLGPVVERTYQHLMMYDNDRLGLAGDLQVRARGATSLLAKETAQVRLNEFLMATANPIDMQIVGSEGRAELLRQSAKRLDIPNPDKVVPSASMVRQRAAEAQMQQLAMAQAQGQGPSGSGQELMDGSPVVDNFSPQPA